MTEIQNDQHRHFFLLEYQRENSLEERKTTLEQFKSPRGTKEMNLDLQTWQVSWECLREVCPTYWRPYLLP
jgi:hypothetical protein